MSRDSHRSSHRSVSARTALDGLNLDVPEGSVFALVGPNGAGKTTAIKILMNILGRTAGEPKCWADSRRLGPRHLRESATFRKTRNMPDWMTPGYF